MNKKDRLLSALERASAAESMLRRLVDEAENDGVIGWEERMTKCIADAQNLLAGKFIDGSGACNTCNGHGMIGGHSGQTPEQYEEWQEPCPDCDPTPKPPSAAPASGVHPDALPDGTLSKSTAKRLAAASVSERARALMAKAYRDGGFPYAAGTLEAGVIDSVDSCALRALEQALTQQTEPTVCPSCFWVNPKQDDGSTAASTQGLRELVQRWLNEAGDWDVGSARAAYKRCAHELESLLTSPTTGADGGGR